MYGTGRKIHHGFHHRREKRQQVAERHVFAKGDQMLFIIALELFSVFCQQKSPVEKRLSAGLLIEKMIGSAGEQAYVEALQQRRYVFLGERMMGWIKR